MDSRVIDEIALRVCVPERQCLDADRSTGKPDVNCVLLLENAQNPFDASLGSRQGNGIGGGESVNKDLRHGSVFLEGGDYLAEEIVRVESTHVFAQAVAQAAPRQRDLTGWLSRLNQRRNLWQVSHDFDVAALAS